MLQGQLTAVIAHKLNFIRNYFLVRPFPEQFWTQYFPFYYWFHFKILLDIPLNIHCHELKIIVVYKPWFMFWQNLQYFILCFLNSFYGNFFPFFLSSIYFILSFICFFLPNVFLSWLSNYCCEKPSTYLLFKSYFDMFSKQNPSYFWYLLLFSFYHLFVGCIASSLLFIIFVSNLQTLVNMSCSKLFPFTCIGYFPSLKFSFTYGGPAKGVTYLIPTLQDFFQFFF